MATGLSLLYTLSDAVRNVRENPATSVFSAFTVGVSLAIFALFMIVFVNVNAAMKTWVAISRNIVPRMYPAVLAVPEEMAKNTAQRVRNSGEEVPLPPMSSFDRRIIHMHLSEEEGIKTESMGEGKFRHIIVYPLSENEQAK